MIKKLEHGYIGENSGQSEPNCYQIVDKLNEVIDKLNEREHSAGVDAFIHDRLKMQPTSAPEEPTKQAPWEFTNSAGKVLMSLTQAEIDNYHKTKADRLEQLDKVIDYLSSMVDDYRSLEDAEYQQELKRLKEMM